MEANSFLNQKPAGWLEGDDYLAFHHREEWMAPYRRRLRFLAIIMYILGGLIFTSCVFAFTGIAIEAIKGNNYQVEPQKFELALLTTIIPMTFGVWLLFKAHRMLMLQDGFQAAAAVTIFLLTAPSLILFIFVGTYAISKIYSDQTKEVIACQLRKTSLNHS